MSTISLQLPISENELISILRRHGVIEASVFGSFARGDFNEKSDLDLLVTFDKPNSLFDQIDLQDELEKATNRSVDVMTKIHPAFEPYITPDLTPLPVESSI